MNPSDFSIQTPHFQALNRVVGTNETDTTRLKGAMAKDDETTVVYRAKKPGNFVKKTYDRLYNAVFGRNLLRKHINAAIAEAEFVLGKESEVKSAILVLKHEANRIKKTGHNTRVSELAPHMKTIQEALQEVKVQLADILAGSIPLPTTHATWVEAEKRGLVHTPCLKDDLPSLSLTNNPALDDGLKKVARGDSKTLAAALASQIKLALNSLKGPEGIITRRSFALSRGAQFKQDMFLALANQMDPDVDLEALQQAVYDGYDKGVSAEATYPAQGGFIPDTFTAGGEDYKLVPNAKLGEAGQSQVAVFENTKGEKVVFKVPTGGDNYEDTVHETLVHLAANKASKNTVKLVDTIRMPSGDLAMVLRFAEHGTLTKNMAHADTPHEKFLEKLGQFKVKVPVTRVRAGVRNREAEKRMADTLTAMGELHTAGISHGDYKPENIFLGKGIQIADFGTAQTAEKGVPPRIDVMNCQAPEARAAYLRRENRLKPLRMELGNLGTGPKGKLTKAIEAVPPNTKEKEIAVQNRERALLRRAHLEAELAKVEDDEVIVLSKADCWGIACGRYYEITGVYPFVRSFHQSTFDQEVADTLQWDDFCAMKTYAEREEYLFGNANGAKVPLAERRMMLELLDPEPNKRTHPTEALVKIRNELADYGSLPSRQRAVTA